MKSKNISRRQFFKTTGGVAAMAAAPAVKATPKSDYDTIVIGAGLSGLHAASILQDNDLNVLVLEGRQRLGGRVYTLMHVPGRPEAAGEWIGGNYARMINTIKKLNLEFFIPEGGSSRLGGWAYDIKGQFISESDWASSDLNPLKGDNRTILPHRMLSTLTNQNNPLANQPLDAWLKPEFAKYDIPFDQYLEKQGLGDEARRLMDVTIHTSHMSNTSALHELRRYHVNSFNGKHKFFEGSSYAQIKGGNSLLPQAMAKSLNNPVLLGKTVVHFEQSPTNVTVHCADGTQYTADTVISSIPMPVLRDITFSPRLPVHMQAAVNEVDYGLSIQVHYLITRRYWEDDGMAPSLWSDRSIERFGARNLDKKDGPAAGVAFINGEAAHKFRLMSDDAIFKYVANELAELRPSMKGALKPIMIQSCERDPHGAGDWVYWKPGQVGRYAGNMRQSHGRIHFCGEHTAIMERGMEGAFESGERAALDVLFS